MDKKFITIREKSYIDTSDKDPFDTGEVSRKQLYTYLFTDFVRGSLIIAFLFIDVVILAEIWYMIPDMSVFSSMVLGYLGGLNLVVAYYLVAVGFLELLILNYERRIYSKVRNRMRDITQTD